jgi:hypothetical protein
LEAPKYPLYRFYHHNLDAICQSTLEDFGQRRATQGGRTISGGAGRIDAQRLGDNPALCRDFVAWALQKAPASRVRHANRTKARLLVVPSWKRW